MSSIVQIKDSAYDGLQSLRVYGNTVQNLWVNPSGSVNGVTFTPNSDGSISISGSPTGSNRRVDSEAIYVLKPNTQYTISIDRTLGSGSHVMLIGRDADGDQVPNTTAVVALTGNETFETFTVPSGAVSCICSMQVNSNGTASGTYRVMLNEGSEPEPWCPPGLNSVGDDGSVDIVTAGKNLTGAVEFDSDWATIYPAGTSKTMVEALNRLVAGTYTLSADFELTETDSDFNGTTNSYGFIFGRGFNDYLLVDSAKKWGADAKVGDVKHYEKQFEVTEDYVGNFGVFYAYGCGIGSTGATGKAHISSVQLELGSTATDYEPPNVTTTPSTSKATP